MLSDTRAILVCVNYADTLRVTLPINRPMFQSIRVVTHPDDAATIAVAEEFGADILLTEIFYARGALFNKFAALELGLESMSRHGWMAVIDADIVFPNTMKPWTKKIGELYTPRRRMLPRIPMSPEQVPPVRRWRQFRYRLPNEPFDGYCQIFHASDRVLAQKPWYQTHWKWCAGPDTFFHQRWPEHQKIRPPFEVLHLGEPVINWAGRASDYADGTKPERSEELKAMVRGMLRDRHTKRGMDKYEPEFIREDIHPRQV